MQWSGKGRLHRRRTMSVMFFSLSSGRKRERESERPQHWPCGVTTDHYAGPTLWPWGERWRCQLANGTRLFNSRRSCFPRVCAHEQWRWPFVAFEVIWRLFVRAWFLGFFFFFFWPVAFSAASLARATHHCATAPAAASCDLCAFSRINFVLANQLLVVGLLVPLFGALFYASN